jgi:lysophospholipase L1-like esterase
MKKIMFALITIFLFCFFVFVCTEIGIRSWDKFHGTTPLYAHNFAENIAFSNGYFNFDIKPSNTFYYDNRNPKRFSFNRWGFRAPEYDPVKPKNTLRIFFFGSSITLDPYNSDEKTWPYLTGKKLSKHTNKKIEAINAGRYGYSSHEIFGLFYHRVLRHSPDLIVLYVSVGDAQPKLSPYFSADDRPQIYGNPILKFFSNRSAFFSWLDVKLRHSTIFPDFIIKAYSYILPLKINVKKPPLEHKDFIESQEHVLAYSAKLFEKNIRTIVDIAREQDVKVLLSTQIASESSNVTLPGIKIMTERLRSIANEKNIEILDMNKIELSDEFKSSILLTDYHFSEKGSDYISDHMAKSILKRGLIK